MASSAFSETLKSITSTKLNELSKKRKIFEDHKTSILTNIQLESDQQNKLHLLVDGVKHSLAIQSVSGYGGSYRSGPLVSDRNTAAFLRNVEQFLEQARYDPTISTKVLLDWETSLVKKLNVQSLKYQYATLYGELVKEWLSVEHAPKDPSSMDLDEFQVVDKADKVEARTEWEKVVFQPLDTDQDAINVYLDRLFGHASQNKEIRKALQALRTEVRSFEMNLGASDQFNDYVLQWTINGLLASGLLSEEKNAVLKDFLVSPVILAEVADVLNMRLASIESWSWDQEYIPVEQRRHLNGDYHIYIDEDLLEAILLQYLGVKWSVFFKTAFITFSQAEGAWKSLRKPISTKEHDKRKYFLGPQSTRSSVQSKRERLYKSIFFMSQLPSKVDDESHDIAGEEEVSYDVHTRKRARQAFGQQTQMMAQQAPRLGVQSASTHRYMMARREPRQRQMGLAGDDDLDLDLDYDMDVNYSPSSIPEADNHIKPKSAMDTKQFLLHLLSTELLLNTNLHGDFTCTRSEFETWSPSLPHSTIRSVLAYFGISKKWLGFFNTFLEAPLRFVKDGASAETRIRKRGVPGAHSLSTVCGEAVLFVLDYAVNQHADGAQLYRMHDDFWLWSSSHDTVVKGWEAVTRFTETMGVKLNKGKTGTVRIRKDQTQPSESHSSLPQGDIRWGFLQLDPSTGRFIIDQDMVDNHIDELVRQLTDKKSIFSYIQAWNTYAGTFFKSNFGKPANCFGRDHVDQILATMTRIQKRIFRESNIVEYLKQEIGSRFGVTDIPDGYLYFPTSLGGLELQNPFIGTIQVRQAVCKDPGALLGNFFEDEKDAYVHAKKEYESGRVVKVTNTKREMYIPEDKNFISFQEFTRYREEFMAGWPNNLLDVYNQLLKTPEMESVDLEGCSELKHMEVFRNSAELSDGYLKWIGLLHGPEMVERFGGLHIVDKGLLPIGMVNLFRSGRIKWEN